MEVSKNSQQFLCNCKQQKGWITEEEKTAPCPKCGRVYRGKYNRKRLCIEAIEVKGDI